MTSQRKANTQKGVAALGHWLETLNRRIVQSGPNMPFSRRNSHGDPYKVYQRLKILAELVARDGHFPTHATYGKALGKSESSGSYYVIDLFDRGYLDRVEKGVYTFTEKALHVFSLFEEEELDALMDEQT